MSEPINPSLPIYPGAGGRSPSEEGGQQSPGLWPRSAQRRLTSTPERRQGERRQGERRRGERRAQDRRSGERRADSPRSVDRRQGDRRQNERRALDRRSGERRRPSRLADARSTTAAKTLRPKPGGRRGRRIDEYA